MSKKEINGNYKGSIVKKAIVYIFIFSLVTGAFVPYVGADGDGDPDDPVDPECPEEPEEPEEPEPEKPRTTKKCSGRSYLKNLDPVANANGPNYEFIDEEVIFDGSASYDPDGTIMQYSWSFGDGTTGLGETVSHKYSREGSYVVELTIMDNFGAIDKDKIITIIEVPNSPPSIPLISGPSCNIDTKYSYAFGSTDPDNDDINYIVDWGDGNTEEIGFLPSGKLFSMLHSWDESGEFSIKITAYDDELASSSEMTVLMEDNIVDNIVIGGLGILALIVLIIVFIYAKKGRKK